MKHLIIVKWKNPEEILQEDYAQIQGIFDKTLNIEGIHQVKLIHGMKLKENRWDLIIALDMDPEALEAYNDSKSHKEWKKQFGERIEQKAIFDFEGNI